MQALRTYRERFTPRGFGLEQPRAILAVNVTVGDTEADARRLVASPKGFYARLARGNLRTTVPSAEDALAELSPAQQDEPTAIVDGRWPRFVAGSPAQVRDTLERMAAESAADEIMVQDMIAGPADRRRSHALLAEAFGLARRRSDY